MDSQQLSAAIERCRAGDDAAAEVVVRRVGRIAMPLAAAVLGSRHDAADVAQDTALDVLQGLKRLRNAESFDAWARRIAIRHALRAARRVRRRELDVHLEELVSATFPDAGAAVGLRDALRAAMADLTPRQRAAVALRYVHDLTDEEIAAALGVRPGTASSLLTRAREILRRNDDLRALVLEDGGTP